MARVPDLAPPDPRARPVAVFDSGVGGLTVLHELLVSLPGEDYLYLGDDARFPYGERTPAELRAFSVQIADALVARGAKLLVVACNSATGVALPALQAHLGGDVDVVGVIAPAAQLAVEATHNGRVGLLATPATVASGAFADAIATIDPLVRLLSVPCPDLSAVIQSDAPVTEEVVALARSYCWRCARRAWTQSSSAAPTTPWCDRSCSACWAGTSAW